MKRKPTAYRAPDSKPNVSGSSSYYSKPAVDKRLRGLLRMIEREEKERRRG